MKFPIPPNKLPNKNGLPFPFNPPLPFKGPYPPPFSSKFVLIKNPPFKNAIFKHPNPGFPQKVPLPIQFPFPSKDPPTFPEISKLENPQNSESNVSPLKKVAEKKTPTKTKSAPKKRAKKIQEEEN